MTIQHIDNFQNLKVPSCILNFNGEVLDVNELMILDSRIKNKSMFLKLIAPNQFVDKDKYKLLIDGLIENRSIKHLRYLVKTFDNSKSIISVLSSAKMINSEHQCEIFILQHHSDFVTSYLSNRFNFLLNEIKQIDPYLNVTGKEKLKGIITQNCDMPASSFHDNDKFTRLNTKLINLNLRELTLCLYLSHNLSNTIISNLTGYSMNAIRVNIHRICLKLGIQGREQLELFLERI